MSQGNKNYNQNHMPNQKVVIETVPDALSQEKPDLSGIEAKVQKALAILFDEVAVLKAKTANMPLSRPVFLPSKENHNTDTVAGM